MDHRPATAAASLAHANIVLSALGVMNEHGLEALTMRRLAQELNVQAPSLYWHIKDKRALLEAMLEHLLSGSVEPIEEGEDWSGWLTRTGQGLQHTLLRYRDAPLLVMQLQVTPRLASETMPRIVDAFAVAGFGRQDAIQAAVAFVAFVVGWVQTEQNMADLAKTGQTVPDSIWAGVDGRVISLRRGDDIDMQAGFDMALSIFLAGCRVRLNGAG